jgi:gliding motility-associated-like protein
MKQRKLKQILLPIILGLFFILHFSNPVSANQFPAGSQFEWTKVGQDSFLVTLVLYHDCNWATNSMFSYIQFNIGYGGSWHDTMHVPISTIPIDVTPVCNSTSCTRCSGQNCSFPFGMLMGKYIFLVHFENVVGCEVEVQMESSPSRNTSLTTLNPYNGDCAYDQRCIMNRCVSNDKSPVFQSIPHMLVCQNQNVYYDPDVVDADGDSLVFSLIQPNGLGTDTLTYYSPYSYNKPLKFLGFPNRGLPMPRGFHLHPQTGILEFTPTEIQHTAMAIRCDEYRNGVLIGTVVQDIHIRVIACPPNQAPKLIDPATYNICAGDTFTHSFQSIDGNYLDNVSIELLDSIDGMSWMITNTNPRRPKGTVFWITHDSMAREEPYVLKVRLNDNHCPIPNIRTFTYLFYVHAIPEANYSVEDSTCGRIVFKAQSDQKNTSFIWQGDGNLQSNADSFCHQYNQPGTYAYSLEIKAGGCSRKYNDSLTVHPFLHSQALIDTSICEGDEIQLSFNVEHALGNISYYWSTGDTSTNSITTNPLYSDSVFVLSATDSIGCRSTDSVLVKVNDLPFVSLGQDINLCSHDVKQIKPFYTINDSSSYFSFAWYKASTQSVISRDSSLLITDSGSYVCQVTNNLGCIGSDTLHVQKMNLQASSYPQTICEGDSCELRVQINSSEHTSFQWFILENQVLKPIGTGQSISVKPSEKSFYVVKTVKTKFGFQCSEFDTVFVDVLAKPEIIIAGDQAFCHSSTPINLKQFATPAYGYWTNSKQEKIHTIIPTDYSPGFHKYYYHLTDSQSLCSLTDSISIQYFAKPDITTSTSSGSFTFCENQDVICLQAYPEGGLWIGSGVNNKHFNPQIGAGTYDLYYYYRDSNLCENIDTLVLSVFEVPEVNISTADSLTIYCENSAPIKLDCSPEGGVWKGDVRDDNYFDPNGKSGTNQISYFYTNNKGCTDTAIIGLHIVPPPDASIQMNKQYYCYTDSFILSASLINTDELLWYKAHQTMADFLQANHSHFQEIVPGKEDIKNKGFWIGLVALDTSSVCKNHADSIFLEFNGQSDIDFWSNPLEGCTPLETTITANILGNSDIASYYWELTPDMTSKTKTANFKINTGGQYDVKLIIKTEAGCFDTLTKENYLHSFQSPEAFFTASNILATLDNASISFLNKSNHYSDESEITWDFKDGSISFEENPTHTFLKPGNYDIELNIINTNLCTDSHSERIIIEEGLKMYIPNAFSPNEDGINDEFKVVGVGINEFSCKVFDRWGKLVYESDSSAKHSWKNEKNLPVGVYTYVIYATDYVNNAYYYSGTISLIR